MARAVEMLKGEKNTFPSSSCSWEYRSAANLLFPSATLLFMTEDGEGFSTAVPFVIGDGPGSGGSPRQPGINATAAIRTMPIAKMLRFMIVIGTIVFMGFLDLFGLERK
jgi:hypothetical protein